jgi:hypothetical protein
LRCSDPHPSALLHLKKKGLEGRGDVTPVVKGKSIPIPGKNKAQVFGFLVINKYKTRAKVRRVESCFQTRTKKVGGLINNTWS